MKKNIVFAALCLLFTIALSFQCYSQTDSSVLLQKGYPVKLLLMDTISSKTAQVGDKINFEAEADVVINGHIVIAKGTPGLGTVTETQESGVLGKKGSLAFSIDELILASGKIITLSAVQQAQGEAKTGAAIATAYVISPLFLLKKGKDISYFKGKEFIAYVNDNYRF